MVITVLFFANSASAQPHFIALTENASIAYFSKTGALMATVPLRGGAKADNIVDFEIGDFLSGHVGPEILVLRKDYYCDIYPISGAVKKEMRLMYLRFAPMDDETPICCNAGSVETGVSKPYISIFTRANGSQFISKMRIFEMPDTNQRKQPSTRETSLSNDTAATCLAAATSRYASNCSLAYVSSDGSVWVSRMNEGTLEIENPVLVGKLPLGTIARSVRFIQGRLCILDAQKTVYFFMQDTSGKWSCYGAAVKLNIKVGLISVHELSN
jgi:hypothetical protein